MARHRMDPSKRNRIRNARCVAEELTNRDRVAVGRRDIAVNRIVQSDLLRVDELQDGGSRDGLAHRIRHHRRAGDDRAPGC